MQERRESSSKINGLIRWFERQKRVYDSVWPSKTRAVTDQSGALFIGNVQEKKYMHRIAMSELCFGKKSESTQ